MTIEQIPADELVKMTEPFHKAFNVLGCNPACHCCWELILPEMTFKLATIQKFKVLNEYLIPDVIENPEQFTESREVMLCENCTPEMYADKQLGDLKKLKTKLDNQRAANRSKGCFRVNGKIVK